MQAEEAGEIKRSEDGGIHLYNAWLPPAIAEETKREKEAFAFVVESVKNSWSPEDPESVYATLKWISIIQLYVKAKSEVSSGDVKALVEVGLEIFHSSKNKLYAQVRWGVILVRLLKKFGKKFTLEVQWRPFYDMLMHTHFKRNTGPEGWRLRQRHFETLTSLVQHCRKFFPQGSASEIWSEFRPGLENPWHNSAFEVSGFVKLFLPMNAQNKDFFTNDWIKKCIDIWELVPNCQFWDVQWASVLARCIKKHSSLDWENFMPRLFTRYLNLFEVPVSSRSGSNPFSLDVPANLRYLFSEKTGIPATAVANAIVYSLKPGDSAMVYFGKLTDILEQYYHPSNGGRWTYSLERFLRHLTISFQKRLYREKLMIHDGTAVEFPLGKSERASFVRTILKIIDRGQYSKNNPLAETVASTISILSYVEPSLVLPFTAARFQLALETVTATHQLKAAIMSIAFTVRPFLASVAESDSDCDSLSASNLLTVCLSNSLLGLDANDPPKTLATMQLIASLFSNLTEISDNKNMPPVLQNVSFSDWLDEFFDRLFSLLQHLESSSTGNEGLNDSNTSETFLLHDSSYYFCMLEVLLGKLSKPLFDRSLKKISKFVNTNILTGAVAEVGLLCCTCLYSNPDDASIHIIKPIVMSIMETLEEFPASGFGDDGSSSSSFCTKVTVSPAIETTLEYQLKVLSAAISYGGPVLLHYREELKKLVASAFNAHSWKVYGAGDHLLRSLLGSLVLYYPVDQHRCISHHPDIQGLEEWICSKNTGGGAQHLPRWHIPSLDELSFANELLDQHLQSALDTLLRICQTKLHSEAGNEKEHLKVTLLRIYSSLRGVQSCLPDLRPRNEKGEICNEDHGTFFISGAAGLSVGSSELREKASEVMHVASKYTWEERSDDSILLILVIRIIDLLANFGGMEFEEWSNHLHSWMYESASTIEPPCNFIIPSSVQGKKRPRWAIIEKVYVHNIWRSSQSSYHKFRTNTKLSPSPCLVLLLEDLLRLSLHQYESVRLAAKTLLKIVKRWPTLISYCVRTLTEKLHDPTSSEHVVLGACSVLGSQTVLRHLTMDASSFSSFILGLLSSSHHESLKAQKAISELFVKYNIHFAGLPECFFKDFDNSLEQTEFQNLISKISSMSFASNGLHWRYHLMANRVLLLLTLASRNGSTFSTQLLGETTGHFLKALKSQQPQSRMLAISALNTLLEGSHRKMAAEKSLLCEENLGETNRSFLEIILTQIFQEGDFLAETLKSLSLVHVITDMEGSRADYGSLQSSTDKAITSFYFEFSASWPRTPSWISLMNGSSFYSKFARIFKRLTQECRTPLVLSIRGPIEELVRETERPMQCVAAEALAGMLHSDIGDLAGAWENWVMALLETIISIPSVESITEWAACVRYAVTGKGKYGTRAPSLRHKILDCLLRPLPPAIATSIMAKRYIFLSAAFGEISPPTMPYIEIQYHYKLLNELWENLDHSSAQVREAIGVVLSITCSNLRLCASESHHHENESKVDESRLDTVAESFKAQAFTLTGNIQNLSPSENAISAGAELGENGSADLRLNADVRKMETMFHFAVSSLKSGRSSHLLDMIVALIYPIISLQDTSHKDLSALAKRALRVLKWRVLPRPHLEEVVTVLLSSTSDPNWRTRFASLTYLLAFMYRHTFILSNTEKEKIWASIEELLLDTQVEVREHAASVLANLMNGGDEDLARVFRDRALAEAHSVNKKRKSRKWRSTQSTVKMHGTVLALVATILSTPHDMPSWLPEHVTLLAQFINEPSPVKSTVTKAVAEFRRTHADMWIIQKDSFTEEQLEVLADASSSSSYFA
ncbi:proteasome activating protein 200 isoform X2 [Wolffia australiana]